MREELLAHLTGVVEAELARGSDTQTAIEEAIRRFGAAEDVFRELQSTVPRIERWLRAPMPGLDLTDRVSMPREGELPSQTIRRVMITQAAIGAIGAVCVVGVAALLRAGQIEGLGRRLMLGLGVVSPLFGSYVLVFVGLAPFIMRSLGLEGAEDRSRLRLVVGLAASAVATAIAGLGFAQLVNWCSQAAIFRTDQWWALLVAALMVPLLLMAWARDLDRFRRWGCLMLDDED